MHDIFVVTKNKSQCDLVDRFPHCKIVEYTSDRKKLFQNISCQATTKYAWLVSGDCNYNNFDFAYNPPWHQETQLHVWPTENQTQGGDTCLINAREFLKQAQAVGAVQNYKDVCWKDTSVDQLVKPEVFVWSRSSTADMIIDDATFLRYVGDPLSMMKKTVRRATTPYIWIVSDECDYSNFDFTWRPSWASEQYLHVWPTENQTLGGDTYYVNVEEFLQQQDAIESLDHYQTIQWHEQKIKQKIAPEIFIWDDGIDTKTKEQFPDATVMRSVGSIANMLDKTIRKATTPYIWVLSSKCNYNNFDLLWRPGWNEESFLHVWPTENQEFGGDTFYINVAEFRKQSLTIDSIEQYQTINWHHGNSVALNYSNDIFIWDKGNAQSLKEQFPNATILRYFGSNFDMMKRTVAKSQTANIWIIGDNCDYSEFDFTWRPSWATDTHMHVWPTENQTSGGDTFYVNVAEFQRQSFEIESLNNYNVINWHNDALKEIASPDVVIWANGNSTNTDNLKKQFPDAIVLRNVGSRLDMMKRTARHVKTANAWIISSKCSYDNFDFTWRPNWATNKHIHVWPTENQTKGGDTFFIDVAEFQKQCVNIAQVEEYDAITWHSQSVSLCNNADIVIWNMGGNDDNLAKLKEKYPLAKSLRYIGNHLEMVKKSAKYATSDHFWIISDCCNYTDFLTNWKPDWEDESSIHCWASGTQKFGDTFYIPRLEFLKEADELDELEYYSSIVWHAKGYSRFPWPINYVDNEDLFTALKNHKFSTVYEYFVMPGSNIGSTVDSSLWKKRSLIAYNKNGHVSLCPRDCISKISTKVKDYPYILYQTCTKSTQKPQDIVFISYDEKDADLNYKILTDRFPQAKRVHGIKGNVMAYKEAAKISNTPWYYAVFPKTKIDPAFNFDIHPDYLEIPGHYIFNAANAVTSNCYGHGGVKMYHVKTTIEIQDWGFDFTMSSPVTSIPITSCCIVPADEYEAWRTSFREVLKLRSQTDIESKYRLHKWLTIGNSSFGAASKAGAAAALEYNGDLKLANSWEWLREQFNRTVG